MPEMRLAPTLAALALALSGTAVAQEKNTWSALQRGLYLTRLGDCAACHTVEGEAPYAGNYALPTPFGTIYSANLTPDENTGLGLWTEQDFWVAMTEGVRPDGERLYPAFPYTHFTYVTREDSDAIFAYLRSLDPVRNVVREPELPWPLSDRTAMRGWNLLHFDADEPLGYAEGKSEAWNRGRYLVEGLMHCGGCHSPRTVTGAEQEGEDACTGGTAEGWYAPSLRAGEMGGEGLGDWSEEALASFLKHGRNEHSGAFALMAEVVAKSTQYLTDEDLAAVVTYVKDLPNAPAEGELEVETVSVDGTVMRLGEQVYATQCSACHGPEGEGIPWQFPRLAGSNIAVAENTRTFLRLVLWGDRVVATDEYPTPHAMPGFAWKLDDAQVAAVATYVRNSFGNAAAPVEAETVAELREGLPPRE